MERNTADSPRVQLGALIHGPDSREREKGITSPLPEEVREDDLLGIAAEGDTLLVNLTGRFREAIREQGAEKETLLCYAMVNTLCANTGEVYWAGEFLYNPEM